MVGVLFTLALGGATLAFALWAAMTEDWAAEKDLCGPECGSRESTTDL